MHREVGRKREREREREKEKERKRKESLARAYGVDIHVCRVGGFGNFSCVVCCGYTEAQLMLGNDHVPAFLFVKVRFGCTAGFP